MSRLPPPTTFSEGMRLLFAIAALIAGIAFGLGAIATVAVLVWGGWPVDLYGKIVGILGTVAIGALVLIGITQIGMLLGGPVGRFKGGVSLKDGVTFDAADNDAPREMTVTATATTAPAKPAADDSGNAKPS
jgi:hypothetical protein